MKRRVDGHSFRRTSFASNRHGLQLALRLPLVLFLLVTVLCAWAQGQEDFENIPTSTPTTYTNRVWTGTDGVSWMATNARTDQTLTNKAICTNTAGTVTSPTYTGGMGVLQFNYVRAFTGTSSRTIQVWVNGVQRGANITVNASSDVVQSYSAAINVSGNVILELRTSGAQIKIDDIEWTAFAGGSMVNFASASASVMENAGSYTVNLPISPATAAAGTITVSIDNSSTAVYGAGNNYTTTPAAVAGTITLSVAAGATMASFTVNLIDDNITEPNKTLLFAITGTSAGMYISIPDQFTLTIVEDDTNPTISFTTQTISALESAGAQTFILNFLPTTHPSGTVTIQITNGPGVVYGADYTTNPNGSSGSFTIPFGPNVASISFTATLINDAVPEPTRTVTFTISAITPGVLIGTKKTATLVIIDDDSPPTTLAAGDLAVVGVNANEGACGGNTGEDRISFFCFKDILYGTEIILTDNGYERCNPGKWGNSEGTVRMKRTGPTIPAGQVITFKILNSSGSGNIISVAPDNQWSCTSLNNPSGAPATSVNMNNGGDQLFFMQGGTWNSGTYTSGANDHNATYNGTILYAFSTNPTYPWSASCTTNPNQRSNLPPGIECFSMAPTLASDFNKYSGPITTATQRDWIIRLETTTNWSTYTSCGAYNSTGYNWMTAPVLPITPGAMTPGLWRGAINTDWFECRNWDDARIPTVLTPVVMDATALNPCNVGISPGLQPGGTAVCASLWQHFTSTAPRYLYVQPNSTLNVAGLMKVENTNATALTDLVMTNAKLNAGALEISGNALGTFGTTLAANYSGSQVTVAGNLTIGAGAMLNLQNGAGTSGLLQLGGNFTNLENELHFGDNFGQVVLNGTGDQYIQNSNPLEYFYDLKVAKSGGSVFLTAPIAVRHELNLTQGRVFTTAAALPTLLAGTTAINASNASFIHGPLKKVGDTDFTFPVGKANSYRPASLSAITGGSSAAFTGEYFNASAQGTIGWAHDWPPINHVSDCEYWRIDRSAGAPNARVTLTWRAPESCGVDNLPEMRTAYWDGTMWIDRGGFNTTGTNAAGSVSTTLVESSFLQAANYWTLASHSVSNPLPVELLSFTAVPANTMVDLYWSTASEKDNAFFTVERSTDADRFAPLLQVPGAGNSQAVLHYRSEDPHPLDGLSYYRLRQTDSDGTSKVSAAVPVFFRGEAHGLTVLYDGNGAWLQHHFPAGSTYAVMDATGRVLLSGRVEHEGPMRIPADHLASGTYLIRITDGEASEATRFFH